MTVLANRLSKLVADFSIREMFSVICLISVALFWLDAVSCQINFMTITQLIAIYIVIIPLVLFVSPKGYSRLKRIVAPPYKLPKALIYIIFVTFFFYASHLRYTALFDETGFERLSHSFVMVSIFFFNIICKPLIQILMFMVLFGYKRQMNVPLNFRVILFIIVYQVVFRLDIYVPWVDLNKSGVYLYEAFLQGYFRKMGSGLIITLQTHIAPNIVQFKLQKWLCLLPVVFLLPGAIESKKIGLGKPKIPRKKVAVWTFSVMALDMFYVLGAYFIDNTSFSPVTQMFRALYFFYLAAIYEEIRYRGIMQNYFCIVAQKIPVIRKFPNLTGIFIAAVLFSLSHYSFDYNSMLQGLVFGMLYGMLFYKTGTIWSPAIAHGTHNLIINSFFRMA